MELVLELLFLTLMAFAFILMILTVTDREEITWPLLSISIWLILAFTAGKLESAYAFISSSDTVVTGVYTYSGGVFLQYLFMGIAVVFVVLLLNRHIADMIKQKLKPTPGG